MFDWLTQQISDRPWTYLLVFVAAGGDVLVPLIPSETVAVERWRRFQRRRGRARHARSNVRSACRRTGAPRKPSPVIAAMTAGSSVLAAARSPSAVSANRMP